MTKVVYNDCYGGFGLSDEAVELYLTKKGVDFTSKEGQFSSLTGSSFYVDGEYFSTYDIDRADSTLVEVIEELGERANTCFSKLKIADIKPGESYRIDEYDGIESVMTVDDYDWKTAQELYMIYWIELHCSKNNECKGANINHDYPMFRTTELRSKTKLIELAKSMGWAVKSNEAYCPSCK